MLTLLFKAFNFVDSSSVFDEMSEKDTLVLSAAPKP